MGRSDWITSQLFVADGVCLEGKGRLHCDQRQQLEQMVLHHVTKRAGLLVVASAGPDAFGLRHRDLDVVDVLLVEERLEEAVGEPEHEDVLDGFLAEVVIDPEDVLFRRRPPQSRR